VERIATTPMSRQQHDQAVTALAVLITVWLQGHPGQRGEAPASRLPLPSLASDTHHASAHARDHHPQNKRAT
jgi:hypothetical protein